MSDTNEGLFAELAEAENESEVALVDLKFTVLDRSQ